jgi:outer membrane protein OmpA-like peptidoglycan-associated protein
MRHAHLVLVLTLIGTSATANSQSMPNVASAGYERFDVSLGYNYIRANAPPGGTERFGLNGGYASAAYRLIGGLWLDGEYARVHADTISMLGQNLTLNTFAGGPRYGFQMGRMRPYVQAMFGVARASDSYFPTGASYTTSASSFMMKAGGGIDFNLNHRFAVRVVQAQYMRTTLPNGSSNEQKHLDITTGVVIHFGGNYGVRKSSGPPPPPPVEAPLAPPQSDILFACSANQTSVEQGQVLKITATTAVQPRTLAVNYAWESTGGAVEGSGTSVIVPTAGLALGGYRVTGHAVAVDGSVNASCNIAFVVVPVPAPPASLPPTPTSPIPPPTPAERQKRFQDSIKDVYFDLNKSVIRPDQTAVLDKDAAFLVENRDMRIQIGGFADQRGSSSYNLALGERRAHTVLDWLVSKGVVSDRIQIVTFGREAQACTSNKETCWQLNRRVGFVLQP